MNIKTILSNIKKKYIDYKAKAPERKEAKKVKLLAREESRKERELRNQARDTRRLEALKIIASIERQKTEINRQKTNRKIRELDLKKKRDLARPEDSSFGSFSPLERPSLTKKGKKAKKVKEEPYEPWVMHMEQGG